MLIRKKLRVITHHQPTHPTLCFKFTIGNNNCERSLVCRTYSSRRRFSSFYRLRSHCCSTYCLRSHPSTTALVKLATHTSSLHEIILITHRRCSRAIWPLHAEASFQRKQTLLQLPHPPPFYWDPIFGLGIFSMQSMQMFQARKTWLCWLDLVLTLPLMSHPLAPQTNGFYGKKRPMYTYATWSGKKKNPEINAIPISSAKNSLSFIISSNLGNTSVTME